MVSNKPVLEDLNLKFRSKFNHGSLHCAIPKALYIFKGKRANKPRDSPFFLQNVQNEIFKVLKMFKINIKLIRGAC